MRLFFAVWPPPAAADIVMNWQEALRTVIPDATWPSRANLHFTLRFLGDVSPTSLAPLEKAARRAASRTAAFPVQIRGLGAFPPRGSPHVIWVGLEKGRDEIIQMADLLDTALADSAWPPPDKPFRPHLTLARIKSAVSQAELEDVIRRHQESRTPEWIVTSFHLIESTLTPRGPVYRNLMDFEF